MTNVRSDTEIYKNTYHELVCWVKELLDMRRQDATVYDRNIRQAGRIMELEFDLRKYRSIMVQDRQEEVAKEYGTENGELIPEEELIRRRKAKGGGNGGNGDWLSPMAWGTQFFVRHKTRPLDWLLVKFMLAGMKKNVALLVPMHGDENIVSEDREWLPVDPKTFIKYWELIAEFPPPEIK